MNAEQEPEEMTSAERELSRHLTLLQDTPDAPGALTTRVVRTARWQQAIRPPLLVVAHLAAAAADAMRLLLGGSRP